MDIVHVPARVLSDLVRDAGYTVRQIEELEPRQVFEKWLEWHGIINWSSAIWEVCRQLQMAPQ